MGRPKLSLESQYQPVTESGCWIFTGAVDKDGYGQMTGNVRAHRAYFERYRGPVPAGMFVLHRCDVRCCVNPAHMFLGDNALNTADRHNKNRSAFGERSGMSKLTADAARRIYQASGTYEAIAREHGVSHGLVGHIKRRLIWKRATGGLATEEGPK
jgi:hypothetical protein